MKTLELTEDTCQLLADALVGEIEMWESHNEIMQMHGTDEVVNKWVVKNNEKIMKLKTLLDYINS